MPLFRGPWWLSVVAAALLLTNGGCPWARRPPLREILPPSAPMDQVLSAVNANSAKVRSLFCTNATLRVSGAPVDLRANLAVETPRNLRLRADTPYTGPELDVGGNNDEFWLWIRRNNPPAFYSARYDQFANSPARQAFPIDPSWLIEALGIVTFSPQEPLQGPSPRGGDRVEVRGQRNLGGVALNRVVVIDSRRGVVLEQHLYAQSGERIASAITSEYELDAASQAALPHRVDIDWPAAKLQLRLDLKEIQVNTLGPNQAVLWEKPAYPGYPNFDLADPNVRFAPNLNGEQPAAQGSAAVMPQAYPATATPAALPPVGVGVGTPFPHANPSVAPNQPPLVVPFTPVPSTTPTPNSFSPPAGQPGIDPNVRSSSWNAPAAAPGQTLRQPEFAPTPQPTAGAPYVANPTFDISPVPR